MLLGGVCSGWSATKRAARSLILPRYRENRVNRGLSEVPSLSGGDDDDEFSGEYHRLDSILKDAKDGKPVVDPWCFTFIITADLGIIVPFDSAYPWSGLWNAYSPFTAVPGGDKRTFKSLHDLCGTLNKVK